MRGSCRAAHRMGWQRDGEAAAREDVDRATSVRPSTAEPERSPFWRLGPRAQRSKHRKEVSVMNHKVVSQEDWLVVRKELLVKEKEFSRLRDERRRDLPWEKVEKEYTFDGPKGKETLAQLFAGKS